MAEGVLAAVPDAVVVSCPVADGGEGTVDVVTAAVEAGVYQRNVHGPLHGQEVEAAWAYLPPGTLCGLDDSKMSEVDGTAVIEMAQASGFSLLPEGGGDPMAASTLGTGELIVDALDRGCRQIVVGIGGSGTVDGGTGMAVALGYRFLDGEGEELPPGGSSLPRIRSIDVSGADRRLADARFMVACDVDNPLVGDQGAARVYGPQKGASPRDVEVLEKGLVNLGRLMSEASGLDVPRTPGAGAAGGLGAGLMAFCGARVVSGFGLVAAVIRLREKVNRADLVLTGEGSFDSQTVRGKAPAGVADIASRAGVPTVIVAGRLKGDPGFGPGKGVAAYCVVPGPMDEAEAMRNAGELLRSGTRRLMGLVLLLQHRWG